MRATADAARLMVITDHGRWSASTIAGRISELCARAVSGTVVVQLRDRELSGRERLVIGAHLRRITRDAGQLFLVSDRLDLAVLLGADGIALPEQGVSAAEARVVLREKGIIAPLITRAWHDPDTPVSPEVDLAVLSPILSERKGRAPLGLQALTGARRSLSGEQQLFALGGVDAAGAAQCIAAGAHGVAVMEAAFAGDPDSLLESLAIIRN